MYSTHKTELDVRRVFPKRERCFGAAVLHAVVCLLEVLNILIQLHYHLFISFTLHLCLSMFIAIIPVIFKSIKKII